MCDKKKLESIRRQFFWGGVGENKKLTWVKWDKLLSTYGVGGLNIGSLRAKNLALVGKWWSRFKIEGDALWVRVIKSRYGKSGGLDVDGVGSRVGRSGLWCDIVKVGLDIDKVGIGFSSSFSKCWVMGGRIYCFGKIGGLVI